MAVKGLKSTTTGADVLNAVRSSIIANNGLDYADRVPVATQENLKDVGKAILEYTPTTNQFLDALINRIGLVVIRRRMYKNKLAMFKRGFLDFGDSIEEIFVDIAKAYHYEPEAPENNLGDVWEQFKPKVVSAFHKLNREDFYPVTVNEAMLKRAFTGWNAFDNFIAGIFDSIYNADELDEFEIFKHLLGEMAKGSYQVQVSTITDRASAENFSIQMRSQGLNLEYMSRAYNPMGVATRTVLDDQILILRADIVPQLDVRVLANSFNMNMAQPISGRILVVNDFGAENPSIVAMIVDKDFSMIYDTKYSTESVYNARHLYWNYFLHHHQIISFSPFANCIAFTTGTVTPSINEITIKPQAVAVIKGTSFTFETVVDYTGVINTDVTYAVTGGTSDETVIDATGKLTVGADETATTLTVTATSVADSTKTSSSTVTVANSLS